MFNLIKVSAEFINIFNNNFVHLVLISETYLVYNIC
jgi:hypothetical protein